MKMGLFFGFLFVLCCVVVAAALFSAGLSRPESEPVILAPLEPVHPPIHIIPNIPYEPPEPAAPIEPPQIPPPAPPAVIDGDELAVRLAEIAAQFNIRGCNLAIFEGENIIASISYGTAAVRDGQTIPANSSTIYRTASISKLVSALLVMQQVDAGAIRLDDTIADLIHPQLYDRNWPDDKATLRHLLSHTAGIVDNRAYIDALGAVPFPSLDSILEQQSPFNGIRPGTSFGYTNFGLGLAAAVIENATGQYFYQYARDNLFEPLGIDACYLTDGIADRENVAILGVTDPLAWRDFAYLHSNIPLGQMYRLAHAELYTSADSLARIGMILAGDGTLDGARYISEESLGAIHTPHIFISEYHSRGLAVHIASNIVEGVTLFGHQGDAYGSITCMFYDPLTRRGVVFLSTNAIGARNEHNNMIAVNQEIVQMVWGLFND